MNQGICEFFVGNYEFAAPLLDSLTDVLPLDAFIPLYAGLSYKQLSDTDMALYFLERSALLAIPVHVADIYHHLGRAYRDKRMFSMAFGAFEKVLEINPENIMVYFDLALTHEEYNLNRKAAYQCYEQFLEKCNCPNSPEAKYTLDRMTKIKEVLFFEGN
jgi:tetratricopeptide (TPR) repeat protein